MGMGYGSNCAHTISIEEIRKLLPLQMKKFEQSIKDEEQDIEYYFQFVDDFENEKSYQTLEELIKAFEKLTNVKGEYLSIAPYHHDSNEYGDRYDDVNGAFFVVVYTHKETAPYIKFKNHVFKSFWVSFG